MKNGFIFVVALTGGMAVGGAYALSFALVPARFPDTFDDVPFSGRVDALAQDYENYAGLSPYQQIVLREVEERARVAVEQANAEECALSGEACDIDPPAPDNTIYEITPTNNNPVTESSVPVMQASSVSSDTGAPQVATGYCSVRQPEIPQGQTVPLGSPVRFNDLPASASERSRQIAEDSKKGMFCSPYGCREKFNNRGSYRPHQGIDIGCTADWFGMPIYTPADGVVTRVGYAQRGKSAGNYIRIKHSDGWETQYMHLEKIFVTKGQTVSAGCAIGLLGHSGGNADAANPSMGKSISHLHYEVIYNGSASNVKTPNGGIIQIVRGGNRSCGNFKAKIKPDDFVTYHYK